MEGWVQGPWKDNAELVLNGSRASVLQDGKVLEKDGGDGCTAIGMFFFFKSSLEDIFVDFREREGKGERERATSM